MRMIAGDFYPQLDAEAQALLRVRLADLGDSRAALAAELGVSRSAISQALDGKYPGDTRHLKAKIVARYADQVQCPATGQPMPPAECKTLRERPLSACTASRETVRHWQACQCCVQNPARSKEGAA